MVLVRAYWLIASYCLLATVAAALKSILNGYAKMKARVSTSPRGRLLWKLTKAEEIKEGADATKWVLTSKDWECGLDSPDPTFPKGVEVNVYGVVEKSRHDAGRVWNVSDTTNIPQRQRSVLTRWVPSCSYIGCLIRPYYRRSGEKTAKPFSTSPDETVWFLIEVDSRLQQTR